MHKDAHSSSSGSSNNTGAIAGGVIGGLAAIGILAGAVLHFKKKSAESSSLLKNASDHGFDDDNI
jgi:hypothetical protein